MHIWRPAGNVRVKALGLAWRDNRLLASEIYSDDGALKGVRPLGGSVEFGETWRDTILREFKEELGVDVTPVGKPMVDENIYNHHGALGHEIVFVCDVIFPDDAYVGQDYIEFFEDQGQPCVARWFEMDMFESGKIELFPNGLLNKLKARSKYSDALN